MLQQWKWGTEAMRNRTALFTLPRSGRSVCREAMTESHCCDVRPFMYSMRNVLNASQSCAATKERKETCTAKLHTQNNRETKKANKNNNTSDNKNSFSTTEWHMKNFTQQNMPEKQYKNCEHIPAKKRYKQFLQTCTTTARTASPSTGLKTWKRN